MLPTYSAWCDPDAISDPALLEAIGLASTNAAVGVLCNPHLTGDALARVAENANTLVKVLEQANGGAALMAGRTTEDQVAIVRAAANRSAAGARLLTHFINPEAALVLYREMSGHRLATHREVADGIRNFAERGYPGQVGEAGYAEMMTEIVGPGAGEWVLISDAYRATTAAELIDLTPRLMRLLAYGPYRAHLPGVMWNFPEVTIAWARHGGIAGATLAAGDHRCNPELLQELLHTWRDHRDGGSVIDALLVNPTLPLKDKKKWLTRAFDKRVKKALKSETLGRAFNTHDLGRYVNTLSNQAAVFNGVDPRRLVSTATDAMFRQLTVAYRLDLPLLVWLDVVDAAQAQGRPRSVLYRLVNQVLDVLPNRPSDQIIDHLAGVLDGTLDRPLDTDDESHMGDGDFQSLVRSVRARMSRGRELSVVVPREYPDGELAWSMFHHGTQFTGPGGTAWHPGAHLVRNLTTLAHWQELYRLDEIAKEQNKAFAEGEPVHGERIAYDEPAATRIARVSLDAQVGHAADKVADLIPSGLGSL